MSHNHLDNPPNGKDLEAWGDLLDEQKEFMPGVMTADLVKDELEVPDPHKEFAWGVLITLKRLDIKLTPSEQELVLSNIEHLHKCLKDS